MEEVPNQSSAGLMPPDMTDFFQKIGTFSPGASLNPPHQPPDTSSPAPSIHTSPQSPNISLGMESDEVSDRRRNPRYTAHFREQAASHQAVLPGSGTSTSSPPSTRRPFARDTLEVSRHADNLPNANIPMPGAMSSRRQNVVFESLPHVIQGMSGLSVEQQSQGSSEPQVLNRSLKKVIFEPSKRSHVQRVAQETYPSLDFLRGPHSSKNFSRRWRCRTNPRFLKDSITKMSASCSNKLQPEFWLWLNEAFSDPTTGQAIPQLDDQSLAVAKSHAVSLEERNKTTLSRNKADDGASASAGSSDNQKSRAIYSDSDRSRSKPQPKSSPTRDQTNYPHLGFLKDPDCQVFLEIICMNYRRGHSVRLGLRTILDEAGTMPGFISLVVKYKEEFLDWLNEMIKDSRSDGWIPPPSHSKMEIVRNPLGFASFRICALCAKSIEEFTRCTDVTVSGRDLDMDQRRPRRTPDQHI